MLASSQPYDFGFDNGEDTGLILVNGVPYTYDKAVTVDAPWLTESPTEGTVATGDSQAITVSVDSTGLAPGVYRAAVRIRTNDPDNARILVPVMLVVPKYQQGVNAGGNAYVDPTTGDLYATDRAFSVGGFGYVGGQARSNPGAIAGTDRDPLYQDLRTAMSAYRFAVPNGVYQVDLSFAELQLKKAGATRLQRLAGGHRGRLEPRRVRRRRRPARRLRPVVHHRGHRRGPRHRVRRPARRPADRQRDPRDGASTGSPGN